MDTYENYVSRPTPPLRLFKLGQTVEEGAQEHWDKLASGQLAFAGRIYPQLRPQFGWIDEFGDVDAEKVLAKGDIHFLFWANIFGPDLVHQMYVSILAGENVKTPAFLTF